MIKIEADVKGNSRAIYVLGALKAFIEYLGRDGHLMVKLEIPDPPTPEKKD